MTLRLLLLALALNLLACGGPPTTDTAPATDAKAQPAATDRAQALEQLYAEFWEERLRRMPLMATQLGDPRYNDQLPNTYTPQYREESHKLSAQWLQRLQDIGSEGLSGQAALSYQIFARARQAEIDGQRFPDHLLPLNQFYSAANQFAMLGSGRGSQPFRSVEDYDNWARRAAQIPALFEQMIANMREGMAAGIVQPRVLMEKVLPQLDALIKDSVEDTLFWQPIAQLPDGFDDADKARLTESYRALIGEQLLPAYRSLREFVASEYIPASRDSVGLSALPDGAAWYAYRAARSTTTQLTPEQIHQIGLDEVARIQGEMRALQTEMGIAGELSALFAQVKSADDAFFPSEEALLTAYRDFRGTVDPLLPALFDLAPKADFEIRAVESFRAASSSAASYQSPAQDGSRPGIFYVNTYDLGARPRYAMASLYLHEAAPGHHFQIALQQELDGLPAFRRYGGETAFSEGWGLYSEWLGYELGVYADPVMRFGALDAELWRSIRLVVDTGIHAKGWSRQQVLDYMYANSATEATRAVSEAERFMAIPGQALAYKIGELKIRELRQRAEAALGERFDVRAFHREVLIDGSLPLDVLEAKIERWMASVRAG